MEDYHILKEHVGGIFEFADRLANEWENHVVSEVRKTLASSKEAGIYAALEPAINSVRDVLWSILELEQNNTVEILDIGAFLDVSAQATGALEVATAQRERITGFKDKWENLLDQCDELKAKLEQRQNDISQTVDDTQTQLDIVKRRRDNVFDELRINRHMINESRLAVPLPLAVGRDVVVRLPIVGNAIRDVVKTCIDRATGPNHLQRQNEGLIVQNHQNDFEISQLSSQLERQDRALTELAQLQSTMDQLRRPEARLGVILTEFDQLSHQLDEECNSLSIRVSQIKGHIEDLVLTATESNGDKMVIVKAVENLLRNIQRRDSRFYTMLDGIEDMVKLIREKRRREEYEEFYAPPRHVSRVSPLPSTATFSDTDGPTWSDDGFSGSETLRSVDASEDTSSVNEISTQAIAEEGPLIDLFDEGDHDPPRGSSVIELLDGLEIKPEEPLLIDLSSDPQVHNPSPAHIPSITVSLDIIDIWGVSRNISSQTPSLLDVDLPTPLVPDVVVGEPQYDHVKETRLDPQDGLQSTPIHAEGSTKTESQDPVPGSDPNPENNTSEVTALPPCERGNFSTHVTAVGIADEPSAPRAHAHPVKNHHGGSDEEADNADSDSDSDSDIFEIAPQTPTDITQISSGQEREKLEDESLGMRFSTVATAAV